MSRAALLPFGAVLGIAGIAGFGRALAAGAPWGHAAWWLNLQADPQVVVELAGAIQREVLGRPAVGGEHERLWQRWRELDEDKNLDSYAARRPRERRRSSCSNCARRPIEPRVRECARAESFRDSIARVRVPVWWCNRFVGCAMGTDRRWPNAYLSKPPCSMPGWMTPKNSEIDRSDGVHAESRFRPKP
jgi:hypothetical protein